MAKPVDRLVLGLGAVLLAAGCAHAEQRPNQTEAEATATQLSVDFPQAQVLRDPDTGQVERIFQLTPVRPVRSDQPEAFAKTILATPPVAATLGLSPDLRELCSARVDSDTQVPGHYVVRLQQCLGGAKVLGGELVMNVRVGDNASVESLVSSLVSETPQNAVPSIGSSAAERIAIETLVKNRAAGRGAFATMEVRLESPELVVFAPKYYGLEGSPRLSWLVRRGGFEFIIDAAQGSVLHQSTTAENSSPN